MDKLVVEVIHIFKCLNADCAQNLTLMLTLNLNFNFNFIKFTFTFQAAGLFVYVVPQSNQVHLLHHLAQLQMDHFKNIRLYRPYSFPASAFLFFTRLHHKENSWSLII